MAYSSSTGFRLRGSLSGQDVGAGFDFLIADSTTIKVGDAVRLDTNGDLVLAGVGNPVLGIAVALKDQNGLNLFTPQASGLDGATLTEDDQVQTASDNTSDATKNLQAEVMMDPAGDLLWYNDADGNFTDPDDLLTLYDVLAASDQIDQSTASDSNGQFQLVKLDPDNDGDASKGLFRIAESQLGVGVDQGNALNAA